jgi:hypothetical protein
MASEVTYPDVTVKLIDTDSNAFALIGKVAGALEEAKGSKAANEFARTAMDCRSFDALLSYIQDTVIVR